MSCQPPITSQNSATKAVVALGSNLAHGGLEPAEILAAAIERLRTLSISALLVSRTHVTEPEGLAVGAPAFCNAVAVLEPATSLSAECLLTALLTIEAEFGRTRAAPPSGADYSSRTLDLDLISCRDEVHDSPRLQLPHPRTAQRDFVLAPLAEIWPDLVLPQQSLSVLDLLRRHS